MSTRTDEQHVREVIDTAMSGTRPPQHLAAGALARGRQMRTRRRAGYVAVSIAASIALAIAVPWVATGGDRRATSGDLVATQPPVPEPSPARVTPGWWNMPATDMVAAVEVVLPDGIAVTGPGPIEADTPQGGPAQGFIVPQLVGDTGPGRLNVMLYPGPAQGLGEVGTDVDVRCGGARSSDRVRCEELLDVDGEVVGRRLSERWTDSIVVNEVVLRRDGGTVYAASSNTLDDKWGPDSQVTSDRPPLSLDQLEDLVRDDTWVSFEP